MAGVLSNAPLVIIGGGPAGLVCANVLRAGGVEDFWLLESGTKLEARQRNAPRDVISGVGGAGLYSDGKFSFYPSASGLWTLQQPGIKTAYAFVKSLLEEAGVCVPEFPVSPDFVPQPGAAVFKPYPSVYLDLDSRYALIERLYSGVAERVRLGARVVDVFKDGEDLILKTDGGALRARHLICAGGRFFPVALQRFALPVPMRFGRVEVGVRIEGDSDHPFFGALLKEGGSIDPKLLMRGVGVEWRTFCFCREGEVVLSDHDGVQSFSGRSDCPPSGRSNVGLNTRFTNAEGVLPQLQAAPFKLSLKEAFVGGLKKAYGATAGDVVRGLRMLCARYPSLEQGDIVLYGPTIEGVGAYPVSDAGLGVLKQISVAGDASGRFRGLVAAMVSGAFAAGRHVSWPA